MASSSTPSSSSTTTPPPKKYEVFLSFRGEDTRKGFTSHLYDALCRKNIKTFKDDDELRRGVEISPALLRAIGESKIAVVIFSKNYASSEWCLAELAEIIERMESKELIVMPVFYHVRTDDVQERKGSYDCSFANKAGFANEAVQKWREALKKASNQAGFDSSVISDEAKLVREIVKAVWRELRSKHTPSPSDLEGLVGIHERIEQVKALLRLDMKDVRKIIGIWGMGGVGKTTIARAVFQSFSYEFDGACIIEKVGKKLEETDGSEQLKREVLSRVLHEENLKLDTPIRRDIMEMLKQKKVFIVLDDVDIKQIRTILPLKTFIHQCGLGSRIIITSRDKHVLRNFKVDHEIHEKGLDDDEAHDLFHKHANPTEDCMEIVDEIVYYAGGNPLALEVLGLHFNLMDEKSLWESALKNLKEIDNLEIFDVLKISYDGLNEEQKQLFLDLACFEDGPYIDADGKLRKELLDELTLRVLIAKSLVTESDYMEMHDLLREMGREIVRKKPGMCSRLCKQDDIIQIQENNTGTDAVEGISLNMDNLEEDIHLSSQVFDKMDKLRILFFDRMLGSNKVHLPANGLNCLPDKLRILNWPEYPLRVLPSNFKPKELVKLDLSDSKIEQLWDVTKPAPKLKWLNLSGCEHLTRIPNLSDFPLLEEVDLTYCKRLVDFPSSVRQHKNLRKLYMNGTAIEEVPSSIQSLTELNGLFLYECTRLKHISDRICKLKSLSVLDLDDCSKLEIFPEILETMESLERLSLSSFMNKTNMDLKVLPLSIERLNGLRNLSLSGCKNLEMLPSSICNLTTLEDLNLSYCSKLIKLPDNLGNLKSLKCLNCSGCSLMEIPEDIGRLSSLKELVLNGNMFESLPKSIKQLFKLEFMSLNHCNMLRSLPEFPEGLEKLEAMDCDQLCQVPDASEFVRCINSKSHFSPDISREHHYIYGEYHRVDFRFANSLNLIKAVSNVFEESIRIMQHTEKGSGKPPNEFSIFLPGNKIPEWFSYPSLESSESSVKIRVLRNDLVNRKFMGFAICAVFRFAIREQQHTPGVDCVFETYYDHIKIGSLHHRYYKPHHRSAPPTSNDSDHMLLGYCSFYSKKPMELPAGDSDYVDISIRFTIPDIGNRLKCCAAHPINAEEPIEIIGATLKEIGETSGRRSD